MKSTCSGPGSLLIRATTFLLAPALFLLPAFAAFTLDPTFASGGRLTMSFPDTTSNYSSRAFRVFVQPAGRIVVSGSFTRMTADGNLPGVAVSGLLTNGTVENTFVLDWQSHGFTSLADTLMYPDGRVLRLSHFFNVVGSSTVRAARMNADGSNDEVFSSNVSIGNSSGFGTARPSQISLRSDGKILVLITENSEFFLYRLNPNGTRDATFGVNGVVAINFNKISIPSGSAMEMLVLNDGKILLTGHVSPSASTEFFLGRLTEAGYWDKSFGRVGFLRIPFGPGLTGGIQDATVQPDGKILLCGTVSNPDSDTWIMRIKPNGRADTSFGTGGTAITDFVPGGTDAAHAMALSSDGKIRIAGVAYSPSNFLVARFSANGTLEDSTAMQFTSGQYAQAYDLTLQPDGKVVVVGETKNPDTAINGSVWAIARLTE